ncbi:hypothetical protein E2C01_064706 [Portunus trituberculatus]|uniref:Uncharacterized protein n=1 Tax=Portunus trituberculatus TaxID=210409 RepID=A0A5B7HML0_PORTR|nr:hypothetical protein [Portunus trituberculatus]
MLLLLHVHSSLKNTHTAVPRQELRQKRHCKDAFFQQEWFPRIAERLR